MINSLYLILPGHCWSHFALTCHIWSQQELQKENNGGAAGATNGVDEDSGGSTRGRAGFWEEFEALQQQGGDSIVEFV